jgi:hypothetical protein
MVSSQESWLRGKGTPHKKPDNELHKFATRQYKFYSQFT